MSYPEEDEEEYDDFYVHWTDQITNGVGIAWAVASVFWILILIPAAEGDLYNTIGGVLFLLAIVLVVLWPVTLFGIALYLGAIVHFARSAAQKRQPWRIGLSGAMALSIVGLLATIVKYWRWLN